MADDKFDITYIAKSIGMGLIPIKDNTVAVNQNAITDIERNGSVWIIHISGGRSHNLTEHDMIMLEGVLRTREIEAQENLTKNYINQLKAQAEAAIEFQRGLPKVEGVPGQLINPGDGGSPPRQWAGGAKRRR